MTRPGRRRPRRESAGGQASSSSSTTRSTYPGGMLDGSYFPRASTAPVNMNSAASTSVSARSSPGGHAAAQHRPDHLAARLQHRFHVTRHQPGELAPSPSSSANSLARRGSATESRMAASIVTRSSRTDRPRGSRQWGLQCTDRVKQQIFLARPAPVDGGLAHAGAGRHRLDAQALRPGLGEHAERGVDDGALGALAARAGRAGAGRPGVRLRSGRGSRSSLPAPRSRPGPPLQPRCGRRLADEHRSVPPALARYPPRPRSRHPAPAAAWRAPAPGGVGLARPALAAARPGIQRITTSAPSNVIAAEISVVRCIACTKAASANAAALRPAARPRGAASVPPIDSAASWRRPAGSTSTAGPSPSR